jgi:hypothetical protein
MITVHEKLGRLMKSLGATRQSTSVGYDRSHNWVVDTHPADRVADIDGAMRSLELRWMNRAQMSGNPCNVAIFGITNSSRHIAELCKQSQEKMGGELWNTSASMRQTSCWVSWI